MVMIFFLEEIVRDWGFLLSVHSFYPNLVKRFRISRIWGDFYHFGGSDPGGSSWHQLGGS